MPKLTAPNGAAVEVSDEKAERLLKQGYSKAGSATSTPKKAPAKKAASRTTKKS